LKKTPSLIRNVDKQIPHPKPKLTNKCKNQNQTELLVLLSIKGLIEGSRPRYSEMISRESFAPPEANTCDASTGVRISFTVYDLYIIMHA
jgi:hypothetical protein